MRKTQNRNAVFGKIFVTRACKNVFNRTINRRNVVGAVLQTGADQLQLQIEKRFPLLLTWIKTKTHPLTHPP